jgi:hypothetical protein
MVVAVRNHNVTGTPQMHSDKPADPQENPAPVTSDDKRTSSRPNGPETYDDERALLKEFEKRSLQIQGWSLRATVVLIFVTALCSFFAYRQSEAIGDSVAIAQQTLAVSNRPWVLPDGVIPISFQGLFQPPRHFAFGISVTAQRWEL